MTQVQIPANAVAVEGDDVLAPATALLRGLNLLGKPEEPQTRASQVQHSPGHHKALL